MAGAGDTCLAWPALQRHRLSTTPRLLATHAQSVAAVEGPADYEAITRSSPWLTHLSLWVPASATALPQEIAGLLSACRKLESLDMCDDANDSGDQSTLVDVGALAAGTHLLSLRLPTFCALTNLAPLGSLVNLKSLDMSGCDAVSDLAPLASLVNLKSLDVNVDGVSDLAFLQAMVNLQRLNLHTGDEGTAVSVAARSPGQPAEPQLGKLLPAV
jgi:hypothetical protein